MRILSVGGLNPKKGFRVLIDAVDRLQAEGRSAELTIVGEGPERAAVEARIGQLGLDGAVKLAGAVTEEHVRPFYEQADVFALACRRTDAGDMDGVPVVLMEAMATGVPCVSTRLSGIPELIRDDEEGLLVPPDDSEALAQAIWRLAKDRPLRGRVRDAARVKIESEFNVTESARTMKKLFHQVLATQPLGGDDR